MDGYLSILYDVKNEDNYAVWLQQQILWRNERWTRSDIFSGGIAYKKYVMKITKEEGLEHNEGEW